MLGRSAIQSAGAAGGRRELGRGAGGRLPTEADWEYACRGGTTTEYSFGNEGEKLGDYGWFAGNSGGQSQPVGAKYPNPWGLFDMHGNVWEWCQDWFDEEYYNRSPKTDPTGPDHGSYRVIRGGSWGVVAGGCRAAVRGRLGPASRDDDLGFRVAAVPSSRLAPLPKCMSE
jgi:formylglycine-generating enzyme required for sulfatase activity